MPERVVCRDAFYQLVAEASGDICIVLLSDQFLELAYSFEEEW